MNVGRTVYEIEKRIKCNLLEKQDKERIMRTVNGVNKANLN